VEDLTMTDVRTSPARAARPERIEIDMLDWPAEAERSRALEAIGAPHLLLVRRDADPPTTWGPLTDWVRVPVDDLDLWARIASLQWRARRRPVPEVDDSDLLRRGVEWVALSRIEAKVMRAFLAHPHAVLSRRQLGIAGWSEGPPGARSVDTYIKRLRRRIAPLGLTIHTVRRRGYLLKIDGGAAV
jgi:two-component system, OmpR family, response regulator